MKPHFSTRRIRRTFLFVSSLVVLATATPPVGAQTTQECLECHDDRDMKADDGRAIGVPSEWFKESVHGDVECVDCHSAPGNFEDTPHWQAYASVDCADCHEDETHSFGDNFHATARARGNLRAPTCSACHGIGGDPHRLRELDLRSAESACQSCHEKEALSYDTSVHAAAAKAGKPSAGCVTCHQSHGPGLPPAAGAVSKLCTSCHTDAMAAVERGGHVTMGEAATATLNCSSCHDAHATQRPTLSPRVAQACGQCHTDETEQFKGSVHEDLLADGDINCVSCHSTHVAEGERPDLDAGCATCHEDEELAYRGSVHRLGRMRGALAASCASCHGGHHILAASDEKSSVYPGNIPGTCGKCHGDESVVTSDFVRLPVSLPGYLESVHGHGWDEDAHPNAEWNSGRTAVCTDCHGTHDLRTAQDPESSINRHHIATTCGRCHTEISETYLGSIHGRAVALGIQDSPTCTDCHDEHLIKPHRDPTARISPEHIAEDLCGTCHTDPSLVTKYGINPGVVASYLDSYHGWAISRGSPLVATCVDCHTVHDIRSPQDPASSVHPANVMQTCAQCHAGSNPTFAQSYTHAGALAAKTYHDYARLIYIGLIIVVLGGMALHNFIVARHEFKKIHSHRMQEPYIQRWHTAERVQHLALLVSFAGLAITGFALRFHDSWWVHVIGLGGHESVRANLHRTLAVLMTLVAVYHTVWIIVTRRGRWAVREMAPRYWDVLQVFQNMAYNLGLRRERPAFRVFDYTQKAEYWAVVWGTIVMAFTGFVLWFPTVATEWMPAWAVRVSEVVHFYEAILAVSAIVIWHFFYVIFMPGEYPMSTVWLNGRYPADEWKEFHRQEFENVGAGAIRYPEGVGTNDMVTSAPAELANEEPRSGSPEDRGKG
jgi:predicted CXXCH cytochrome family protein